jgi:hypothetical protein
VQLPPEIDELEGATELDDLELGATLLGTLEDDGAIELLDDDEAAPSQLPNNAHSCHWPE